MAHIRSTRQRDQKFLDLCYDAGPSVRFYIYRMVGNETVKPYLYAGTTIEDPEFYIQAKFGAGKYYVMFRRGEKMLFTGYLGVAWAQNDPRKPKSAGYLPSI